MGIKVETRPLLLLAQMLVLFSFFAFPAGAFAGTLIYSQTDDSGVINASGTFHDISGGSIGSLDLQTIGTTTAILKIKAPSGTGTYPNFQFQLKGAGITCEFYAFTADQVTELSDGLYHTFTIQLPPFAPNISHCDGSNPITTNTHAAGASGSVKADTTNTYYTLLLYAGDAPPSDTSTRIDPLSPILGRASGGQTNISTTTSSTTVDFSAQYYNNPDSVGFDPLNQITLQMSESDNLNASSSVYTLSPIATSTLDTYTNTIVLPSGSGWTYQWCFGASAPWGEVDEGCTPTQQVFIVSNPIIQQIGTSTTALGNFATSTCAFSNISGCFQNAIGFLFWPTPTDFYYFSKLTGNIQTHAPFGYVYLAIGQIKGINASSTPAFTLNNTASTTAPYINSSIQSVFFTPIKNALALVLWALAIMWFLKRIRDLHL